MKRQINLYTLISYYSNDFVPYATAITYFIGSFIVHSITNYYIIIITYGFQGWQEGLRITNSKQGIVSNGDEINTFLYMALFWSQLLFFTFMSFIFFAYLNMLLKQKTIFDEDE